MLSFDHAYAQDQDSMHLIFDASIHDHDDIGIRLQQAVISLPNIGKLIFPATTDCDCGRDCDLR
jgi:hypothetical protein